MNNPSPHPAPVRYPHSTEGWVRWFQAAEFPVLAQTAEALELMRPMEDSVDARTLTEVLAADPLMTLKLLAFASAYRRGRRTTDVETVREALVLIGITPFFAAFGPQDSAEARLADQPASLAGLRTVLRRAERASRFALGFAVHRADHDAMVIHEAALLHDFADMLLWLQAPALALEMQALQAADATLRSAAVQRRVLGTTLPEIRHGLMIAWRLPELLISITDDRHQELTQVRNVVLAIRLARHTSEGWTNPAVPDDIRDIAQLLNLSPGPTAALLAELDKDE